MQKLAAAFIKAQSEMSNAVKGSNNPFFKASYANLNAVREAILPVLNANGIGVLQPLVTIDGKNYVKTMLIHESGETMESFTEVVSAKQNDPQAFGSAISYARRYSLQSIACIGSEDDDAEGAMDRSKKKPQPASVEGTSQPAREAAGQDAELEKLRESYRRGIGHDLITDTERKSALLKLNTYTKEELKDKLTALAQTIKKRENKQG